jgi:hypothetical protein
MNGSERATDAYLKWLGIVAADLIETHWEDVESIAAALLERGTCPAHRPLTRHDPRRHGRQSRPKKRPSVNFKTDS